MSVPWCGDARTVDARLRDDPRRVVILDDDPTGTQTVSDVDVILQPERADFEPFFASPARALYVLTNTRAMPLEAATLHLRLIVRRIDAAALEVGEAWIAILRGDSTLRGHVFAEADVLGARDAVVLFVPAFPDGGRFTVGGTQWIDIAGQRWNAADTEFARDPTFGYASRDLVSWVGEVGGGRSAAMVALQDLRDRGSAAISTAIERAPAGTVVIPEAETDDDLRCVALGLLDAEADGSKVVIRSAASFAAIRAGLVARRIEALDGTPPRRVLVACGSYTAASTAQLDALAARGWPIAVLDPHTPIEALAALVRGRLETVGLAAVATPRSRSDDGSLGAGAMMMDRLTELVGSLRDDVDAVVAKGGITSATAALSLGAQVARVEGQLAPGIALWSLHVEGRRPMPYVVVPGNVGGPDALTRVLDQLR
jgi:uncharacterized protein YgbK (DUF1537 family)